MQASPQDLGIWIICFASVASVAATLFGIFNATRVQRRQVRMEDTFATVPALDKVEKGLGERIDGVDADVTALKESISRNGETRKQAMLDKIESLRIEVKQDVADVHEKINTVGSDVSALKKASEITNTQMLHLTTAVNNLRS